MSKDAKRNSATPDRRQARPARRITATGQRGYQPQSSQPVDPLKLTPPSGGSSIQPPAQPKK